MLEAVNLTLRLGKKIILDGVSFRAHPGTLTSIVGPNGSGKTTLLRALTGDLPYQGSVRLNGQDIQSLRPWQLASTRAVLPQASALAFPFTVIEVVALGVHQGTSGQCETVAMAALAKVGLSAYAGRAYQELSGGEQQRVQLARVLAQVWQPVTKDGARWLFLDEPVSALDIAHQLLVMSIARDFADQGGGVVAVMHDLNLTAMFSDRITLMSKGFVRASGPVTEVMTDQHLSNAYHCALGVSRVPTGSVPFVLPQSANA